MPNLIESVHIKGFRSGYQKPLDGSLVAMQIGLTTISAQCPRFDEWVTHLETLA